MTRPLNRKELAEHVGDLITGERNSTHGDPHDQFACHVELMGVLAKFAAKGPAINSTAQHALSMIMAKASRLIVGSDKQDHWIDIAGYALIAAEVADEPIYQLDMFYDAPEDTSCGGGCDCDNPDCRPTGKVLAELDDTGKFTSAPYIELNEYVANQMLAEQAAAAVNTQALNRVGQEASGDFS